MKTALRVLLGAVCGTVFLWASLYIYGLLALWSPFPNSWWAHRFTLVAITSKAIAFIPSAIVLGYIFTKLFHTRTVLYSAITTTLVLLVAYGDTLRDPKLIWPTLRLTWELDVLVLLGPVIVVHVIGSLRSNNRWRGP